MAYIFMQKEKILIKITFNFYVKLIDEKLRPRLIW